MRRTGKIISGLKNEAHLFVQVPEGAKEKACLAWCASNAFLSTVLPSSEAVVRCEYNCYYRRYGQQHVS